MRRITPTPDLDAYVLTVAGIAARLCGASVVDVLTGRRNIEASKARRAVSYVLRKRLGLSTVLVGDILNKKHSTIVLQLQKVGQQILDDMMAATESMPVPAFHVAPPRTRGPRRCKCGGRILRDKDGKFCVECFKAAD